MNTAYLSLGSNEGDRALWMDKAMELINENCGTVIKKSPVYETAAWGLNTQPDFLNMVIAIQTPLAPDVLLNAILGIETSLGRHRSIKWGPRIIDIDILLYDDDIIHTPHLTIPHPFLQDRRFTLIPLADIAPKFMHPVLHKTIAALLFDCKDSLEVWPYKQ